MATERRRNDAFGQWLDVTLSNKGITGTRLAAQLGVHDSAVSRWRSGTGRPTMQTAMRLATILEVDALQLAVTAGLIPDGEVTGIKKLPPPPQSARRERVRAQILAIKGLTEESKLALIEVAEQEIKRSAQ